MPGNVTQSLARFAAALTYDQIPDRAREHCKNLLLDAVACALAGLWLVGHGAAGRPRLLPHLMPSGWFGRIRLPLIQS